MVQDRLSPRPRPLALGWGGGVKLPTKSIFQEVNLAPLNGCGGCDVFIIAKPFVPSLIKSS